MYHSKLLKRPKRFRPFAPAVCHTRARQIFNLEPGESVPFMMQIVNVREAYRSRLPGVTHVDGTARVQTVRPDTQPLFHRVIEAYGARRGLPVVLNTSFNLKGSPIVESPAQAMACFMTTEMDAVVLGPWMVDMPDRTRWTPVADPNLRLDADGRLGTVQLRVRIGEQVLDEHLFVLLRSIDGNRTVAQLAHHLDIGPIPLLRQVLSLMRRGWYRWAETPASER